MKKRKWKILIPIVCALAILIGVVGGIWYWRWTSFSDKPFGYRYSIVSVFFLTGDLPALDFETADYALTHDGILLDIHGSDAGKLTAGFRKFTLDAENFDDLFSEDGRWRVTGIDAVCARKNTTAAWKYQKLDGSFYYILQQKNGDVFLCIGQDNAICQFYWIQPLDKY